MHLLVDMYMYPYHVVHWVKCELTDLSVSDDLYFGMHVIIKSRLFRKSEGQYVNYFLSGMKVDTCIRIDVVIVC